MSKELAKNAEIRREELRVSDFHQNGVVTVLHRLGRPNLEQLEAELERHASSNPIALVLPSLYSELSRPALKVIVDTLRQIRYLNEIVISLDRASALDFRRAREYFSVLPQRTRIIWNDGVRIQQILELLTSNAIDIGLSGKGRGCWTAFGYVLARHQSKVIALHDCDIVSYDRQYLARLCYPIVNPNL
ncbi:MAG: glycosyl transferase, partial [Nitrospiraceae bacterium]